MRAPAEWALGSRDLGRGRLRREHREGVRGVLGVPGGAPGPVSLEVVPGVCFEMVRQIGEEVR